MRSLVRAPVATWGAIALLAFGACKCGGTGIVQSPCGLTVTPANLDFGTVAVGQTATTSFTLKNTGSAAVDIGSVSADGDAGFSVGTYSMAIGAGDTVSIPVTFAPAAAGSANATLVVETNSCSSPDIDVDATGTGAVYGVTVAPQKLDFGCLPLGMRSAPQTVTLTNDSNPPAGETITLSVVLADAGADGGEAGFALGTGQAQLSLAPDGSGSFEVLFAPTAVGAAQGQVEISVAVGDGGAGAPVLLAVKGESGTTVLVATPDPVSFPYVPLGATVSQGVVVQAVSAPDGGSCAFPAVVEAPTLQENGVGFSLDLDAGWDGGFPATLSSGDSFSMVAAFSVVDGGALVDTAIVAFTVADGGHTLDIPLNATDTPGPCQLVADPESISFGTVPLNQEVTENLMVSNSGQSYCALTSAAITMNDAAGEFSLGMGVLTPFAFAPGQSESIPVIFTAEDMNSPLSRIGTLTLVANELDSDAGTSIIPIPLTADVQTIQCPGPTSCCAPADAPTIYAHSDIQLFTIDPTTWQPTLVGAFSNDSMFDLAVDPWGNVFTVSSDGNLYSVDAGTAEVSLVLATNGGDNALTALPDGTLIGVTGGGLFADLDPDAGTTMNIGQYGNGESSSGDIVGVADGTLYATVPGGSSDLLVKVDPTTGATTTVGPTGYSLVWGLAYYGGSVLGFTEQGQIIRIDPATGASMLLANTSQSFYGAGVTSAVSPTCP